MEKTVRASITCERIYGATTQESVGRVTASVSPSFTRLDAVIHYVTSLPVVDNLLLINSNDPLPHDKDALVQIDEDVYFRLVELSRSSKGSTVDRIAFELLTTEHDMPHLQAFVERCKEQYERQQNNKLGTSLYFFDQITSEDAGGGGSYGRRRVDGGDGNVVFNKHKFHTTRTLDNVFFEEREKVRKHVDFFLTQKDWYVKKGIPYSLGMLFHGEPGCGKSSFIKAIANQAKRHVINIHLADIKSKKQLHNLFFDEVLHVQTETGYERFVIPIAERLYVIEDVDAIGDVVLKREWKKPEQCKQALCASCKEELKEEERPEPPLDLAFLLNLLDGTLEAPGRIVAITSNFPERIDRAFIRPGRIDITIKFKKCNGKVLQDMVANFYDRADLGDWALGADDALNYKWSPAEVNQIMFRNFTSPEDAIKELKTLDPAELSGIPDVPAPDHGEEETIQPPALKIKRLPRKHLVAEPGISVAEISSAAGGGGGDGDDEAKRDSLDSFITRALPGTRRMLSNW